NNRADREAPTRTRSHRRRSRAFDVGKDSTQFARKSLPPTFVVGGTPHRTFNFRKHPGQDVDVSPNNASTVSQAGDKARATATKRVEHAFAALRILLDCNLRQLRGEPPESLAKTHSNPVGRRAAV